MATMHSLFTQVLVQKNLSKVGPEMGEDIDVVLEKGKVLHIKTLTPGIEVGILHHGGLDSSICVFDA